MTIRRLENEFEQLFKQNFKNLCSYAISYIRDEEIARDIVHDVFMVVWNKRQDLDFSEPMYPYLISLIRNRCINYLEHLKVEHKHKEKFNASPYEDLFEPEDNEELINRIIRRMEELPEKCREVMRLCFMESKRYKEIAEQLDISVNTVKTHLSTGLKILRKDFSEQSLNFFYFFITHF